ncbi:MAG: hypothetical protein K9I71_13135 [Ignavibacteriales bacterium]|nr:hypothetical protein [Ignavibacteriales bacterium]MCF8317068.1 hypothetical protein [Ignavibacteriales bacterium]MCF8438425.1 hypothetical protein [Ignavibacteriales bacterium]
MLLKKNDEYAAWYKTVIKFAFGVTHAMLIKALSTEGAAINSLGLRSITFTGHLTLHMYENSY